MKRKTRVLLFWAVIIGLFVSLSKRLRKQAGAPVVEEHDVYTVSPGKVDDFFSGD